MLDTRQVEVIAALTDVGVYHADSDCIPEWDEIERITKTEPLEDGRWPVPDYRRFWEVAEEHFDYRPLLRYTIDEWESANASDIPMEDLAEDLIQLITDLVTDGSLEAWDYDGDEIGFRLSIDQGNRIGVFCDHCGKRIQ